MDAPVPFRSDVRVWVDVALRSFGGPAGQIGVMHRILVEDRKWISERRFLHALNFCMLLPGPEAMQLATYVGWLRHGVRGGLVAGGLFVLPGFLSILALSIGYVLYQDVEVIAGLLFGLKAAVVAIVADALVRIGRRALTTPLLYTVAAGAFAAVFLFDILFPFIIAAAVLVGWLAARTGLSRGPAVTDADEVIAVRPRAARMLRVAATWALIWLTPVVIIVWLLGPQNTLAQEAVFFSQTAVVTFGGAYAVLAYVAQQAVGVYGWLEPGEMLDGLGMAETTPGPLIQVVQFVGFMGAWRHPGALDPMTAAILASLIVTWVTFAPCFLFVFTGAPYVEFLRGRPGLNGALAAVTAAVVGVILDLTIWFAIHFLFAEAEPRSYVEVVHVLAPVWGSIDPAALVLTVLAFALVFLARLGILKTLGITTVLGVAVRLSG